MAINNSNELDLRIAELQKRKAIQENLLTSQFHNTLESMRPFNLIKSTFRNIKENHEVRNGILKSAAGIGISLLTKRFFLGGSKDGIVSKIMKTALTAGMAKTAIDKSDKLRAYGTAIYHNLFRKNHKAHSNGLGD